MSKLTAALSENCSFLGTGNIRGQIAEHIFVPNGGYFLHRKLLNLSLRGRILQKRIFSLMVVSSNASVFFLPQSMLIILQKPRLLHQQYHI